MIQCADCGTLNRRGSTYCGNCGHDLHAAPDVTCTECNRISPPDSAFCQWCGAPVALAGVSLGDSVTSSPPHAPSGSMAEEVRRPLQRELPPWLYESQPVQAGQPATEALTAPPKPLQARVKSKYLEGIENALPATDAWQAASQGRAPDGPDSSAGRRRESRHRLGCLGLGLMVLLRAIALGTERAL